MGARALSILPGVPHLPNKNGPDSVDTTDHAEKEYIRLCLLEVVKEPPQRQPRAQHRSADDHALAAVFGHSFAMFPLAGHTLQAWAPRLLLQPDVVKDMLDSGICMCISWYQR